MAGREVGSEASSGQEVAGLGARPLGRSLGDRLGRSRAPESARAPEGAGAGATEGAGVLAGAVVRVAREVRPGTRPGEGWPRDRLGVSVQVVSAGTFAFQRRSRGAEDQRSRGAA